jgi:hypothetical protein
MDVATTETSSASTALQEGRLIYNGKYFNDPYPIYSMHLSSQGLIAPPDADNVLFYRKPPVSLGPPDLRILDYLLAFANSRLNSTKEARKLIVDDVDTGKTIFMTQSSIPYNPDLYNKLSLGSTNTSNKTVLLARNGHNIVGREGLSYSALLYNFFRRFSEAKTRLPRPVAGKRTTLVFKSNGGKNSNEIPWLDTSELAMLNQATRMCPPIFFNYIDAEIERLMSRISLRSETESQSTLGLLTVIPSGVNVADLDSLEVIPDGDDLMGKSLKYALIGTFFSGLLPLKYMTGPKLTGNAGAFRAATILLDLCLLSFPRLNVASQIDILNVLLPNGLPTHLVLDDKFTTTVELTPNLLEYATDRPQVWQNAKNLYNFLYPSSNLAETQAGSSWYFFSNKKTFQKPGFSSYFKRQVGLFPAAISELLGLYQVPNALRTSLISNFATFLESRQLLIEPALRLVEDALIAHPWSYPAPIFVSSNGQDPAVARRADARVDYSVRRTRAGAMFYASLLRRESDPFTVRYGVVAFMLANTQKKSRSTVVTAKDFPFVPETIDLTPPIKTVFSLVEQIGLARLLFNLSRHFSASTNFKESGSQLQGRILSQDSLMKNLHPRLLANMQGLKLPFSISPTLNYLKKTLSFNIVALLEGYIFSGCVGVLRFPTWYNLLELAKEVIHADNEAGELDQKRVKLKDMNPTTFTANVKSDILTKEEKQAAVKGAPEMEIKGGAAIIKRIFFMLSRLIEIAKPREGENQKLALFNYSDMPEVVTIESVKFKYFSSETQDRSPNGIINDRRSGVRGYIVTEPYHLKLVPNDMFVINLFTKEYAMTREQNGISLFVPQDEMGRFYHEQVTTPGSVKLIHFIEPDRTAQTPVPNDPMKPVDIPIYSSDPPTYAAFPNRLVRDNDAIFPGAGFTVGTGFPSMVPKAYTEETSFTEFAAFSSVDA